MSANEEEQFARRLTDEELHRVAAQVDYFVVLLADRYKVSPDEVIEAARWVREHQEFLRRIKTTGTISLLGVLVSSVALAAWEGIRSMLGRGN